jgi:hypothetical protein
MSAMPPLTPDLAADLRRLTRTELSMRARVAHVLLALAASVMTIVVTSLWLTEPALPRRTSIAFALLTGLGFGWLSFSIWVLKSKHVMLARHRVVAGRLAASFSSIFLAGCVVLGLASSIRAAWSASAMGGAMLIIALVLWRRAETARARLVARRDTLERELNRSA